ncbi:MarR family winged helix-turn-helix transcriptional regulator [Streptococcus dentasini]
MVEETSVLTNRLCFSIYESSKLFNQYYKKALKPFSLTYTQYIVLLALWEEDKRSLSDLGEEIGLSSNTLTPLLKRLEEKDYIKRNRRQENQRFLTIALTDKGKKLQPEVEVVLHDCLDGILPLSQEEIHQLILANQKINQAFQKLL